tara:strand:- start:133 stop:717 length:585 start_codon:yes stop_codon:yes gene_type:complete
MRKVSRQDKDRYAKNGYDDTPERIAMLCMMEDDDRCHDFICDYYSLDSDKEYYIEWDPILENPKGYYKNGVWIECDVDLAIREGNKNTKSVEDKIVGLIEVDVLNSWQKVWPYYYKWCHRLARKTSYYEDRPYPYMNFSFNTEHTSAIATTREIEEKYPVRYDKPFVRQGHTDNVKEIPLEDALKFGEWVNDIR